MKIAIITVIMLSFLVMPIAYADTTIIVTMHKLRPVVSEPQPVGAVVSTNFPPINIRESPVSVSVQANTPSLPTQRAQLPTVLFATNFRPNIGPGLRFSVSRVPLKELPHRPVSGRVEIPIRDLNRDFPCQPCHTCQ